MDDPLAFCVTPNQLGLQDSHVCIHPLYALYYLLMYWERCYYVMSVLTLGMLELIELMDSIDYYRAWEKADDQFEKSLLAWFKLGEWSVSGFI